MIIALCGNKRVGKDTVAKYLVENYKFKRYGFADPIRESCKNIFLWDDDWIDSHKEEIDPRWGISYRDIAQIIGTEVFQYKVPELLPGFNKKIGKTLWVARFKELYIKDMSIDYVISDLRFIHEYEAIKKYHNTYIIKVERPSVINEDTHPSEKEVNKIPYDFELLNDSTEEVLKSNVDTIINYIYNDLEY
jgi:hypothetical protein